MPNNNAKAADGRGGGQVRGAEQGEQRLELADLQGLPVTQRPAAGWIVESEGLGFR
ncbi:hypothetical protein HK44_017320 [Pseudomonas fluorescens HK44]|uniref:Uncharacterized protein n=1 Tax=Pseudomonas fluorescens HK44 TaxID=1042209 RepID=A0A010T1Q1_PSEFL|nr:hypothetical protein HK44_017320 [Pseudomonas fluorescens HK44]